MSVGVSELRVMARATGCPIADLLADQELEALILTVIKVINDGVMQGQVQLVLVMPPPCHLAN